MSIITLTTDFGFKDHFVGALKGKIYSQIIDAKIVDISHDISPFNTIEAAYIIGCAYSSFPAGTIHLIGVDAELSKENQHVAALWNNHYFVGADNGILSMLFANEAPEKIVLVDQNIFSNASQTDLDSLLNVACLLASGQQLSAVGTDYFTLKNTSDLQPIVSADNKFIRGNVVYIDHLGNAVTNISQQMIETIGNGRQFEIPMSALLNEKRAIPIRNVWKRYSEIAENGDYNVQKYSGSKLAVFNEAGFLEIAIFRSNPNVGSAKTLLGLNYRDVITIDFI